MLISNPVAVTIPVTSNPPADITKSSPNVETPVTFNWSSVNPPTIFALPLASIAPANVETPETFNKSVSVRPVTSIPSAIVDTRKI